MRRLLSTMSRMASRCFALILMVTMSTPAMVSAAITANIANTKHNFSATVIPPASTNRTASATSESQICAFCHTPHGATDEPKAPLWNRKLNSTGGYTMYSSASLDGPMPTEPGGKSKLCLSCHDGTIAVGQVNVLNRQQNPVIAMTGENTDGTITAGPYGADTGYTRRIGVDLSNDHPISMTFDSARAASDGELFNPATSPHLSDRTAGGPPALPQGDYLPLEDDKVECISCHDPHVQSDVAGENNKFLRVNRFQQQPPVDDHQFDAQNDIICLGCHDKEGWIGSAHANPAVGNERYASAAAELREFPANMQVWQAACLNCHDPHTVQGSRRILREGTDGQVAMTTAGAKYKQGGNPAVEEVCWACHSADGQVLQGQNSPSTNTAFEVPDIKTDFTLMARHMPIQSADQQAGSETHNIGTHATDGTQGADRFGQDFVEDPALLGPGSRHAECTDCHNPHRVMKNRYFNADNNVPDAAGTHPYKVADMKDGYPSNIASGVLRGIWGVEPIYSSTEFGSEPVSFEVKRGDPARDGGGTDALSEPYLTREYQLCFKCHTNYAYGSTAPALGSFRGGTPPGTNRLTQYTNQGMEYQSPDDHTGEGTSGSPSGAFSGVDGGGNTVDYETNNHRAWHPVMKPTGRTPFVRGADANDWRAPFNAGVGVQTMYCTDCHGSDTLVADGTVPKNGENGYPWGPHGSDNNFLLKGPWDKESGRGQPNALCFRCHDYNQYGRAVPKTQWPGTGGGSPSPAVQDSGFKSNVTSPVIPFWNENLHVGHSSLLQENFNAPFLCSFCHVAIPHGWKNKVFLANLNDVGLEAGLAPGTQVRYTGFSPSDAGRYYAEPYYNGAALKVKNFARSGEWAPTDCGSSGAPGNGSTGQAWMASGTEACLLLP